MSVGDLTDIIGALDKAGDNANRGEIQCVQRSDSV